MGGAVVIRKRDQRIERHRPRLKEQQRAAETLFDDLLAFVNHKPADDDSEDVRDHLESTLDRIIRATNQDRPVSLHNWMSFRVLRTVKDSQVREIPDEREPLRLYQYAIYELFVWKRSSDVRRCDYPPAGSSSFAAELTGVTAHMSVSGLTRTPPNPRATAHLAADI